MPITQPPVELATAIGRLVLAFSGLEETLHQAIWGTVEAKDVVKLQVAVAGLNYSTLVSKFGALYHELFPSPASRAEVADLANRLLAAGEERNSIIHAAWHIDETRSMISRLKTTAKPKAGLVLHSRGVTIAEIDAAADRMTALTDELWILVVDRVLF